VKQSKSVVSKKTCCSELMVASCWTHRLHCATSCSSQLTSVSCKHNTTTATLQFTLNYFILLIHIHTHTHTHTHVLWPCGLCPELPGWATTRTNLDFTEARDSEWQWHQPGHMQICTSPQLTTPTPRLIDATKLIPVHLKLEIAW